MDPLRQRWNDRQKLLRALLAQPQAWDVVSFEDARQAPAGYAHPVPAW